MHSLQIGDRVHSANLPEIVGFVMGFDARTYADWRNRNPIVRPATVRWEDGTKTLEDARNLIVISG